MRTRGRRLGTWALTLAVLAVGLAATAGVSLDLRNRDAAEAQRRFDARTELVTTAVESEAERYVVALELVAGALAAGGPVTGDRFDAATEPMVDVDFQGATSIAFISSYVTTAEVERAQRVWRSRGSTDLVLQPNPDVDRHVFALFSRPLDGSPEGWTGIDVTVAPAAFAALQDAALSGAPRISEPYELIIDQDLPPEERQASFSLVAPVLGGPDQEPRGWVLMGIRGQDLMGGLLDRAGQGRVAATLSVPGEVGQPPVRVARTGADGADGPSGTDEDPLTASTDVRIAQATWTVDVEAVTEELAGVDTAAVAAVTGAGLSTALAALVHLLAAGRSAARVRIARATADLAEAEAASRRQAATLSAVLDSIGDGVGVVDGSGTVLVHNPAGRELLGVTLDAEHPLAGRATGEAGDPASRVEHYGLFSLDGERFAAHDLPLLRALRGEPCDGVEVVVRNPARPEGVTISVTARPLDPTSGQTGAVAVFRDVTADRQRRDELAAFAGVVAHDLKSPLTAVDGYLSLLRASLSPATGADAHEHLATLGDYVDRAAGAATRMHLLIQGLLDYVTARDAALDVAPVDVGTLVEEVVATYRDEPHPTEVELAVDVPPGSVVMADRERLRQVLDNLVGNAVKYAAPDSRPSVGVIARTVGDELLLEVCDRGLGIPADQLTAVFEPFRRAHGGGVSGSGLGLAICHSVVTRHGGTISARRRPGGGTVIALTLPRACAEESGAGQPAARPAPTRGVAT